MTLLRATLAVLALSAHVAAFAPSLSRAARAKVATRPPRHMADNNNNNDNKEEPTLMKSALKKQIAYDSSSGRFFETNIEEQDCVPDEEFCMTDSSSGELIRLTQEEKERIFLDSLQVRGRRRRRCHQETTEPRARARKVSAHARPSRMTHSHPLALLCPGVGVLQLGAQGLE
jgi:hypothetical protein